MKFIMVNKCVADGGPLRRRRDNVIARKRTRDYVMKIFHVVETREGKTVHDDFSVETDSR